MARRDRRAGRCRTTARIWRSSIACRAATRGAGRGCPPQADTMVDQWSTVPAAWAPRTGGRSALPLAGRRVVLHGRLDLVLGGPSEGRRRCASSTFDRGNAGEHGNERGFHALLERLAAGSAFRTATYYPASGEIDIEDVTESCWRRGRSRSLDDLAEASASPRWPRRRSARWRRRRRCRRPDWRSTVSAAREPRRPARAGRTGGRRRGSGGPGRTPRTALGRSSPGPGAVGAVSRSTRPFRTPTGGWATPFRGRRGRRVGRSAGRGAGLPAGGRPAPADAVVETWRR